MSKTNRQRITDLQTALDNLEQRFKSVKSKLQSNERFLEQIESHKNNSQKWKNEIESLKEQSDRYANEIETLGKEINSTKDALDEKLNSVEVKKDELDQFFIKVFGEENKEGKREGGISNRLDKKEGELDDFIEKQKKRYDSLFIKIESLLPAATSTGLAKAYYDQKESYRWPKFIWGAIFVISLILIAILGYSIDFNFDSEDILNIERTLSKIFARLPYFFALIWLAGFSSRRYRQNNRLQQEYAHKEVLAKSYQGYKKEFESDDGSSKDSLVQDLREVLLGAMEKNPSDILGDGTKDDSPSMFRGLLGDSKKDKLGDNQ